MCQVVCYIKTLQCEVFTSIIFTGDLVLGKSSLQAQWTATIRQKIIAVLASFCTVWLYRINCIDAIPSHHSTRISQYTEKPFFGSVKIVLPQSCYTTLPKLLHGYIRDILYLC